MQPLTLDGAPLTISDIAGVARADRAVRIGTGARSRMDSARAAVETCLNDGRAHYGINTGFGSLSRQRISAADLRAVQHNLIRSHAAGVGEPLPSDIVRGMLLLLAASLCRGHSGVRPVVAERLVALLNAGITPVVPSVGSVGASGDLAPLAHAALALIGEGRATARGSVEARPTLEVLRHAGIEPLELDAKEGLALINGTHLMAAHGSLVLHDARRLFDAGVVALAMSIDACKATDEFLDDRVHRLRGHPGQVAVAASLRALLDGSSILPSHRENDPRVQDPYSLRCGPVVLGAVRDTLDHVAAVLERELAAVTDNPLVFPGGTPGGRLPSAGGQIVSAGNFHGMPLAIALDTLAIALAHLAGISERRTYLMLSAADPESGLTPHLSPRPGLHSGLMIAQYTAAACCNEIIGLAAPASVANIPTSSGMEDYNSFGPRAAAKAARALELATSVVAIELLCAAEGIDQHSPLRSGHGVEAAHAAIRRVVPRLTADRPLTDDIRAIEECVRSGLISLPRE